MVEHLPRARAARRPRGSPAAFFARVARRRLADDLGVFARRDDAGVAGDRGGDAAGEAGGEAGGDTSSTGDEGGDGGGDRGSGIGETPGPARAGPRRRGLHEDRAEGVPVVHVIDQIEGELAGPRRA